MTFRAVVRSRQYDFLCIEYHIELAIQDSEEFEILLAKASAVSF